MSNKLLKSKKIRETPFRLKVVEILLDKENPITLEELENKLESFDRITLYRTIKTFKNNGLIHEIKIADEPKKIALCSLKCTNEKHIHHLEHIHFFCEVCKETYCLDNIKIPNIEVPNYIVSSFDFTAKGTCEKCL